MPRPIRVILKPPAIALAGLSFLLLLAALFLWARSHFVSEAMIWNGVRHDAAAGDDIRWSLNTWSARGGIGLYFEELWKPAPGWGRPQTTFHWARDRMAVYPYVPIPQLRKGRSFQAAGITLFEERSGAELITTPGTWLGPMWHARRERVVILPYWLIALISAPLPVVVALHWRRNRRIRRRERAGQCIRCGYDLRATRDRCPECGAIPSPGNPRH